MVLRFENLLYLNLLWLLPFMVALFFVMGKHQKWQWSKYLSGKVMPLLISSVSTKRRQFKLFLQVVIAGLMIVALARPQTGQSEEKVVSEGIELMILFDISRSMLAEDVKPSRLEFAKKEVIRFLDLNIGHRIGLVAFAGSGLLLSPMTTDKAALKMFVESLTTESVSSQGTEFRGALETAHKAFERGGVDRGKEEPQGSAMRSTITRAILIVSDGEDHEPGALLAAENLLHQGIHIFTLGFGTEKGGVIPIRDAMGNVREYYKDKSGKVILTQTKGTILRELAKKGEGSFRHVTYGGRAMEELHQDLKKLRQSEFESMSVREYNEKYQWLLGLALLLAALEMFLGERRPPGRIWKGRFEVAKH